MRLAIIETANGVKAMEESHGYVWGATTPFECCAWQKCSQQLERLEEAGRGGLTRALVILCRGTRRIKGPQTKGLMDCR